MTDRRNTIPRFFWYTVAILGLYFLFTRLNIFPSIGDWFRSKPVTIDNTAILVSETRSIAQLMTLSAYNEVVVDSVKLKTNDLPVKILVQLPVAPSKLVIIARGRVIAGVDLQKLKTEKIFIKKDSVSVTLPSAEILDLITNPSDFEIFSEEGSWTADEVAALKTKAREKIKLISLQQQIVSKANEQAKLVMKEFLTAAGFKKVSVFTQ